LRPGLQGSYGPPPGFFSVAVVKVVLADVGVRLLHGPTLGAVSQQQFLVAGQGNAVVTLVGVAKVVGNQVIARPRAQVERGSAADYAQQELGDLRLLFGVAGQAVGAGAEVAAVAAQVGGQLTVVQRVEAVAGAGPVAHQGVLV